MFLFISKHPLVKWKGGGKERTGLVSDLGSDFDTTKVKSNKGLHFTIVQRQQRPIWVRPWFGVVQNTETRFGDTYQVFGVCHENIL